MTDTVLQSTAKSSLQMRPKFALARAIEWVLFPVIKSLLSRTRRSDGSYPVWVMNLPNALTVSRSIMLPLAALFAWAAWSQQTALAVLTFAVIAFVLLTDGIDGAVARYVGAESVWGRTWDPFFDKFATVSLLFWWLVLVHHFNHGQFTMLLWLVIVRIVLDVVLAGITYLESRRGREPRAGTWGKVKAFIDDIAMLVGCGGIIAFSAGNSGRGLTAAAEALLLGACVLAPMSIYQHWRNLRRRQIF